MQKNFAFPVRRSFVFVICFGLLLLLFLPSVICHFLRILFFRVHSIISKSYHRDGVREEPLRLDIQKVNHIIFFRFLVAYWTKWHYNGIVSFIFSVRAGVCGAQTKSTRRDKAIDVCLPDVVWSWSQSNRVNRFGIHTLTRSNKFSYKKRQSLNLIIITISLSQSESDCDRIVCCAAIARQYSMVNTEKMGNKKWSVRESDCVKLFVWVTQKVHSIYSSDLTVYDINKNRFFFLFLLLKWQREMRIKREQPLRPSEDNQNRKKLSFETFFCYCKLVEYT